MKKFSKEFNGYNKVEVNKFLTDVITETEKMLTKLERQQNEIIALKKQIIDDLVC